MTTFTSKEIQSKYRLNKRELGWKRIQIWKLDETNQQVQNRVKKGAKLANTSKDEAEVKKISAHIHKMLQDIPL